MAGTKIGGLRAAATNKRKHGEDFYVRIGREGGKLGRTGGFYADRGRARWAGAKGGTISRRGPAKPKPQPITLWDKITRRLPWKKVSQS